jgi:Flp pilus assembly protein TadB
VLIPSDGTVGADDSTTETSEVTALASSPSGKSVCARADPASSEPAAAVSIAAVIWAVDWAVMPVLDGQGIQVVVETTVIVVRSRSLTDKTSEQHMGLMELMDVVVGWVRFA